MKKYLWFSVLLCLLSALVTICHEKNTNNAATVNWNGQDSGIAASNTPQAQDNSKQSQRDSPCWNLAYLIFGWPNGITVWALFLTMVAIAEQSYFTRVAADASLTQANHLVASERAWAMVEAKFEEGTSLAWNGNDETDAMIEVNILNAGPTPAWVYEQYVYLQVSPNVIASRTKCPIPDFPFTGEGSTEMFGHVNYEIHPITRGQSPATWKAWVRGKGIATPENGLHVYIFGVVRYRDAFSSLRETYFGYCVKSNKRLERIPNEAYNKHT